MDTKTFGGIAIGAMMVAAGSASAGVWGWDWERGDTNSNDRGGKFDRLSTTFDTQTEQLTFDLWFQDQTTDGFTLALNDGPNPKGHAGELALVYVDALDTSDAKMNVFAYNGRNTQTSFEDGSPQSGLQTPDRIATTTGSQARQDMVSITVTDLDNGGRHFSMVLDATIINGHTPMHPGSMGPEEWYGIGFDELIGIWLHPVTDLSTGYDSNGFLDTWEGTDGYLDVSNRQSLDIPAPGAVALLAMSGGLVSRRRRG